jgi:hypothetical protein
MLLPKNNAQSLKTMIALGVMIMSFFLMFYNLGYYALWDDEADTALFAESVWRTGDTYALLDHNLIAHTDGQELKGLYNRFIPPLGFYLAAPFVGLAPGSAFAARLPFAVCGLLTVALMLFWLWRARVSLTTWWLTAIGILGNVSLMLYARQCRYYSPAILATTVLAYLYVYRDHRKRTLMAIAGVSLLLLASNYLFYAAVYTCFFIDYLLWGRKNRVFSFFELAIIAIPQLVLGGLLISKYNLLGAKIAWSGTAVSWIINKASMYYWNLREMNSCEHGVGILIILSPFLFLYAKDNRLLRLPLAIFTYAFAVALLSPRSIEGYNMAVVRYLAPVIPFCIFTAVLSIQALTVRAKWLAVPLAILAFGTNVLHGGPLVGGDKQTMFSSIVAQGRFRSTVGEFIAELIDPPPSAYRTTADWINQNLKDKDTVWVIPGFATYPLMYHAPKVIYAWQLKKKEGQFDELPDIHFAEKIPPDYAIGFGPLIGLITHSFAKFEEKGIRYEEIAQIDMFWYDLTRPELYWHSFREIKDFSRENEAVYIFKRKEPSR